MRLRLGILFMLIISTAAAPAVSEELAYKKDGIRLDLLASRDLNNYNAQSHTLVLVTYQLSDPNMFNQMLDTPEGIGQLLEGGSFDASVLSRNRMVIHPGDREKVYIDRAAGARYLGIITGYFSNDIRAISRVVPIELRQRNKFFWRPGDADPADTILLMGLGRDGIIDKS